MELDTTNQSTQTESSITQNPTASTPTPNNKSFLLIIIGVVILLIAVSGVSYYVVTRNALSLPTRDTTTSGEIGNNSTTPITMNPTQTPTPTVGSLPSVKPGFQQYSNSELRYGFNYAKSDSLYHCTDIPCLSINRITMRIEMLGDYLISSADPKSSLLNADLYCSADGPGGSISCKNTKVEDYTNSLGFKGYKVIRTRTVTGTGAGIAAGNYADYAYVYLLPEVKKGPGLLNYAAIMFAVDSPTPTNLNELTSIAKTFFTF